MLDSLLRALNVDAMQWRALVRTAWRVDLRMTGAMSLSRTSSPGKQSIATFVVPLVLMGAFITVAVFLLSDLFFSATFFFSFVVFSIGSSLLLEFHAIVLSPDDHRQLGYLPIDSRTFFAARLASVLIYVGLMTAALGALPILAFALKETGGPLVALAATAGLLVSALLTTFVAIGMYVLLLHYVSGARLKRALTWLQLAATFFVYASYFLLPNLAGNESLRTFDMDRTGWVLLLPGAWFAGYVDMATGRATAVQIAIAALTVVACVAGARLLVGRLSLDYADRLAAINASTAATTTAVRERLRSGRLFRSGERRAIALLVRGLFRHDMKFRLGVLSIVPLTIVYLFGGAGPRGVSDPFVSPGQGAQLVYFAVLFFPSMLQQALSKSDSFRAAWILHATPADSARLVLATKDFVLAAFVLPYLAFVAALIAYWFERLDHLAVLMLTLALLTHLIVMLQLWMHPELPFSQPALKGSRTRDTFLLIFVVSFLASFLPHVLHIAYATPARVALTLATLILLNLALLRLTTARVRRLSTSAEFLL